MLIPDSIYRRLAKIIPQQLHVQPEYRQGLELRLPVALITVCWVCNPVITSVVKGYGKLRPENVEGPSTAEESNHLFTTPSNIELASVQKSDAVVTYSVARCFS